MRNPTYETVTDNLSKEQRILADKDKLHSGNAQHSNVVYNLQDFNFEKPKFSGIASAHPVTFIEDIKSYLNKMPAEGKVVEIIMECLTGDTRNWARVYKNRWTYFEDFQRDFLDTYWGEAEQNLLRRKIVNGVWDPLTHPTMLGHFIHLTGQAQMLTYKGPEKQMIADIIRHYPRDVQHLWTISKSETVLEAAEFLRSLDEISKQGRVSTSIPGNITRVQGNAYNKNEVRQGYQRWRRPEASSGTAKPNA